MGERLERRDEIVPIYPMEGPAADFFSRFHTCRALSDADIAAVADAVAERLERRSVLAVTAAETVRWMSLPPEAAVRRNRG